MICSCCKATSFAFLYKNFISIIGADPICLFQFLLVFFLNAFMKSPSATSKCMWRQLRHGLILWWHVFFEAIVLEKNKFNSVFITRTSQSKESSGSIMTVTVSSKRNHLKKSENLRCNDAISLPFNLKDWAEDETKHLKVQQMKPSW